MAQNSGAGDMKNLNLGGADGGGPVVESVDSPEKLNESPSKSKPKFSIPVKGLGGLNMGGGAPPMGSLEIEKKFSGNLMLSSRSRDLDLLLSARSLKKKVVKVEPPRPPSPECKVIKKMEEDMEVFTSDMSLLPDQGMVDKKNLESSGITKEQAMNSIYKQKSASDNQFSSDRQRSQQNQVSYKIDHQVVETAAVLTLFNDFEAFAYNKDSNDANEHLDLQVGGPATREEQLYEGINHPNEHHVLPQFKLDRLAQELQQLENELLELEKSDIKGNYADENEQQQHLKEIDHLKAEMGKILGSDAFVSHDGKSKIQDLLNQGSQVSVHNALNLLIQQKVTEYQGSGDEANQEGGVLNIGKTLQLNFLPQQTQPFYKDVKMEEQIIQKFQEVDQTLDQCEKVIGHWQPQNKFLCMYRKLDELGDQVEDLDSRTMDMIGNRAKELNRDLEDILRRLQNMEFINYDKNKIDYLYMVLCKSMENEEHVEIVLDRLKSLEKIHKESPNIEDSINTIVERQELIDRLFVNEDAQIVRTKEILLQTAHKMKEQVEDVGKISAKLKK